MCLHQKLYGTHLLTGSCPHFLICRLNCSEQQIEESVNKAQNKHYQLACGVAFEGIHKCSCDVGINHPTQYYMESRRVTDEQSAKVVETGSVAL